MQNPVAKHQGKFNHAVTMIDRKKAQHKGYRKHRKSWTQG